jgi:hypothetical protein
MFSGSESCGCFLRVQEVHLNARRESLHLLQLYGNEKETLTVIRKVLEVFLARVRYAYITTGIHVIEHNLIPQYKRSTRHDINKNIRRYVPI